MSMNEQTTRLDEFDEDEWLEVQRYLRPDIPDEQHRADFREFIELKRLRTLN